MTRWFTEEEVRRLIDDAVAPLKAKIAELEAAMARLKKNSTTSSKPPSSDIVKPPRPPANGGKRGKRRGGGQFGHLCSARPFRLRVHLPFDPQVEGVRRQLLLLASDN